LATNGLKNTSTSRLYISFWFIVVVLLVKRYIAEDGTFENND